MISKIDYHISPKHTLTGFLFIGNYTGVGEDHAFVNQAFTDTSPIRAWSNVENWLWVPSPTTVNVFRFGYNRVDFGFLNNDANILSDGKGYPLNTGVSTPGGLPNIYISPFGSFGGGSYLGTNPNRPQSAGPNPVFDFTDSISYLRGKHAFRFGGEFTHIEADSLVYVSGRGRIAFSGGNLFGGNSTGLEDFFAGLPSKAQVLTGNPNVKTTWVNYATYVQDDWRLSTRFTLNLGLRWSYVSPIKEANNLLGSFDPNSQFGMVQQGQKGLNTLWRPITGITRRAWALPGIFGATGRPWSAGGQASSIHPSSFTRSWGNLTSRTPIPPLSRQSQPGPLSKPTVWDWQAIPAPPAAQLSSGPPVSRHPS